MDIASVVEALLNKTREIDTELQGFTCLLTVIDNETGNNYVLLSKICTNDVLDPPEAFIDPATLLWAMTCLNTHVHGFINKYFLEQE